MMCRLSTLLVGKQRNNVDMYPGALYLVVMSEYIVLCRKYSIWRLSSGNIYYLLMIVIIITCLFDNVAQNFECEDCTPWEVRICKLTVSVMKPSLI